MIYNENIVNYSVNNRVPFCRILLIDELIHFGSHLYSNFSFPLIFLYLISPKKSTIVLPIRLGIRGTASFARPGPVLVGHSRDALGRQSS